MSKLNPEICRKFFCDHKVHSDSDFRKAMLALRKKGLGFEKDPEFVKMSQCKGNVDFPASSSCLGAKTGNKNYYRDGDSYVFFNNNTGERYEWAMPKEDNNDDYWAYDERTGVRYARTGANRAPKPYPTEKKAKGPPLDRCPRGTRRDKRSGECKKVPMTASARAREEAKARAAATKANNAAFKAAERANAAATKAAAKARAAAAKAAAKASAKASAKAKSAATRKRCPKGMRRDRVTHKCVDDHWTYDEVTGVMYARTGPRAQSGGTRGSPRTPLP